MEIHQQRGRLDRVAKEATEHGSCITNSVNSEVKSSNQNSVADSDVARCVDAQWEHRYKAEIEASVAEIQARLTREIAEVAFSAGRLREELSASIEVQSSCFERDIAEMRACLDATRNDFRDKHVVHGEKVQSLDEDCPQDGKQRSIKANLVDTERVSGTGETMSSGCLDAQERQDVKRFVKEHCDEQIKSVEHIIGQALKVIHASENQREEISQTMDVERAARASEVAELRGLLCTLATEHSLIPAPSDKILNGLCGAAASQQSLCSDSSAQDR